MNSIITKLKEKAKNNKKTIVLPETMDNRILKAAEIILKEDIADIILIGEEEILNNNNNLSKAKIINPKTSNLTNELIERLYELRKEKSTGSRHGPQRRGCGPAAARLRSGGYC